MFGIGGFELVLIILFVLMIFGPDKLPELGRTFGKAVRMFAKAKNQVETVVRTEILRPEDLEMLRDPLGTKSRKMANPLLNTPAKPKAPASAGAGSSVTDAAGPTPAVVGEVVTAAGETPPAKAPVSTDSADSIWAAVARDEAEEETEE